MAKKYGTRTGNELLTAVQTGRLVGAEIGMIDMDVIKLTNEMWSEMSFWERTRYTLSTYRDRFGGKRRVTAPCQATRPLRVTRPSSVIPSTGWPE